MAEKEKGSMGTVLQSGATGAKIGSMILPGVGTAIGAGLGALGGWLFGGRKPTDAELAQLQALKELGALPDIDWASTVPNLTGYQAQTIKDAILEGDRAKISSAFEQLPEEDPVLRSAKMQALGSLQRQGKEGFTLEDEIGLRSIQDDTAAAARRSREDVLRGMEQRGMASSGAAIATQLGAEQTGANRAAQEQLAIAAQRQAARRQALMQSGSLASDFSAEDFRRDSTAASAKDIFSKFNEEQAAGRDMRNVAARRMTESERLAEQRSQEQGRVGTQNEMARARAEIAEKAAAAARQKILDKAGMATSASREAEASKNRTSEQQASLFKGGLDMADKYLNKDKVLPLASNVSNEDANRELEKDKNKFGRIVS